MPATSTLVIIGLVTLVLVLVLTVIRMAVRLLLARTATGLLKRLILPTLVISLGAGGLATMLGGSLWSAINSHLHPDTHTGCLIATRTPADHDVIRLVTSCGTFTTPEKNARTVKAGSRYDLTADSHGTIRSIAPSR